MIGDFVLVINGDLKNLTGWVEKVDEDIVHIRPKNEGLPKTLTLNKKELCKYFELGSHVKVVAGAEEGETGMVVKVEQHVMVIISDTTKQQICVFADHVMESSGVIAGGSSSNGERKSDVYSRFSIHGTPPAGISQPLRRFRGGPTRKIAIC
ncbi:putative transcription elongation factor SPT5 homolog 1 [Lotus japonicus]|uniref:putative transcription elongation factor SPT5 homolog 1 n=1 Tax=Lotus japonicus TaxID=34305 RepID=UPI00258DF01B|nr:putative transcription elongation factor SPT5 homolog 1 [Lotus japonicus]